MLNLIQNTRHVVHGSHDNRPKPDNPLLHYRRNHGGVPVNGRRLSVAWRVRVGGDRQRRVFDRHDRPDVFFPKSVEEFPRVIDRVVPIFPELRPYLDEGYFRDDGDKTWVVPMLAGNADKNLGTRFRKIIRRAGVEVWPKPFQNCRSSRQTELEQQFPTYVVCAWPGNTPTVAHKHYLTVTDDHFTAATETGDQPGTQPPVGTRGDSQKKTRIIHNLRENASFSEVVAILEDRPVAARGLEPPRP